MAQRDDSGRAYWLAIEGGGSKTRVLLATPDGDIAGRWGGLSASGLYCTAEQLAAALAPLVVQARERAEALGGRIARVGAAGPLVHAGVRRCIDETLGLPLSRYAEGRIALAAAGVDWGVALVAGTGSSAHAYPRSGRELSVGGFGPQFGDEGSGYWIGREAVSAAMRAATGQNPPTALSGRVLSHFDAAGIWDLPGRGGALGHVPPPKVAALAPAVFDAAREGDAVAASICLQAGQRLAALVADAVRLGGMPGGAPLVCAGGVFHGGGLVLAPLCRGLEERGVALDLRPPVLEPGVGILGAMARDGETTGVS